MPDQPPLPDHQGGLPNPWNEVSERSAYAIEATQLTQRVMDHFWDAKTSMFKAPELSADAVQSDPPLDCGYLLWPSLCALHAVAEGEWHSRFARGASLYRRQIESVFNGLERYYDAPAHAYNAWVNFPGNNDKYDDDNSLAVVVLVDCYNATLDMRFLERAWQVMANFVFTGWDASGSPGGMRWGTDPHVPYTSDKTVSATAFAALAAFRLAEYYPDRPWFDRSFMVQWGFNALDWVWTKLRDEDNLVRDGLRPDNGGWTIMDVKWSYNTGVPIRAYVEHYRLTDNQSSLSRARTLALAAINRDLKPLFDGRVTDPNRNFWHDNTFFVQHLIADGLMEILRVTDDSPFRNKVWDEIRRHANYMFWYIRDADGNVLSEYAVVDDRQSALRLVEVFDRSVRP